MDRAHLPNSKGVDYDANPCSRRYMLGLVALYVVPREELFLTFFEWKHVLAKRFYQEDGSCEDQSSAVRSDNRGSPDFFAGYWVCQQLPTGTRYSCTTALENEKWDWGGCSAGGKGLECSIDRHWLGKVPDCVLALPHLRQ